MRFWLANQVSSLAKDMMAAQIKLVLGSIVDEYSCEQEKGPQLLVAASGGQDSDISALIIATLARAMGWELFLWEPMYRRTRFVGQHLR